MRDGAFDIGFSHWYGFKIAVACGLLWCVRWPSMVMTGGGGFMSTMSPGVLTPPHEVLTPVEQH